MTELRFRTTVVPFGPAAAVVLDDDQVAELSSRKTPPVVLTVGEASVRVRVSRMGGQSCIGLSKENRAALGVEAGDEVEVTVALDEEERTVEIPEALATALAADPGAKGAYDALSYTRRKEMARSVAAARRAETRERRLAKILEELEGA